MLKTTLLHPLILSALGRSGHGSQILIADGNFPFATATWPAAEKVYLNLRPGVVGVIEVLETLTATVPIEAATVMAPPHSTEAPIFDEFRRLLPGLPSLDSVPRFEFYERTNSPSVALVIATGERRRFANILLTIGVVLDTGSEHGGAAK